jgi:hypothetical protein
VSEFQLYIKVLKSADPNSVGVGFSYADFGETVETTEDAAKNVHAFISIFFETFKQFSGRALHLSGESYGVCINSIFMVTHSLIVLGPIPSRFRKRNIRPK